MMKLVIQDDEGKTTVVPLIRDEITVGRKEGNTIRLTERNVSRKHARIVRSNGSIAVEDLNSYNGVRVNGSRIQGRVGLNVSDRIQIGDYLIELKAEGSAVPTDAFGDETQPVETMAAAVAARSSVPSLSSIPQAAPGDDDATTKMATPMTAMLPAAQAGAAPDIAPPAPQPEASPPARLVILSTSLAGQEYEMTQLAMVIGRTEDNDVVINHRSISRHHAKIVNENGRYAIVDMQSSNGVRVNGEEYSKVELRRGDVIDLGHVRMRFVEPGEDFLFGRDAHAVTVPGSGNRSILYIGIAVVLLGALGLFLLTRGGDDGEKKASDVEVSTGDGDKDTSAGDKPTASTSEDLETIKPLLEVARTAIEEESWTSALGAAKKALEIAPTSKEARELVKRSEFEKENKERYEEFKEALKNKNAGAVADSFRAIDDNSIYKEKARSVHDEFRDDYIAKIVDKANNLAKKRKCGDLEDLREAAIQTWEEAGEALAEVECEDALASNDEAKKRREEAKKRREEAKKKPDEPKDDEEDTPPDNSKPTKSYKELMDEARAAMMKNQYGKARRLCDDALKVQAKDAAAATMCGIAACNMKKARLAKKYQAMVPAARKAMIRQQCLKAGLTDFQ